MRRTIADELKEEGATGALQQTLIRLLKRRFGKVPDEVTLAVRACRDPAQLAEWLDRFATADTMDDLGIEAPA